MFSQVSVCLHLQPTGGMHPTGMHSCVLIIMKDERPNVFKLVKTNFALDFVKHNASLSEGIIFDKISGIVF